MRTHTYVRVYCNIICTKYIRWESDLDNKHLSSSSSSPSSHADAGNETATHYQRIRVFSRESTEKVWAVNKKKRASERIAQNLLDMRTRLASLIVVKQEPLTTDYLESEQNALIGQTNYNEVDAQFYGLTDRRDILPQSIGDLNNNNNNNNTNYAQSDDFNDDKKCMYSLQFIGNSQSNTNNFYSISIWIL